MANIGRIRRTALAAGAIRVRTGKERNRGDETAGSPMGAHTVPAVAAATIALAPAVAAQRDAGPCSKVDARKLDSCVNTGDTMVGKEAVCV